MSRQAVCEGPHVHFKLVVVGAHDGSKMERYIRDVAQMGNVLLVEPVPFLFDRLKQRFANEPTVRVCNYAVSMKDEKAVFAAPRETAKSVVAWGDEVGSLVRDHAARHRVNLDGHIEIISVT